MTNGWIEKYKANASRLKDSALAELAADMEARGYDANPEQWDELNSAVDALPPETPEEKAKREAAIPPPMTELERSAHIAGEDRGDYARPVDGADGKAGTDRYVSSNPPGSPDNPIGYPGTDQDQDPPGTRPKTVPGQKVTKP